MYPSVAMNEILRIISVGKDFHQNIGLDSVLHLKLIQNSSGRVDENFILVIEV